MCHEDRVIDSTFGWVAVTPLPTIEAASDRLGITAAAVEVTDAAVAVRVGGARIQRLEQTWGAE